MAPWGSTDGDLLVFFSHFYCKGTLKSPFQFSVISSLGITLGIWNLPHYSAHHLCPFFLFLISDLMPLLSLHAVNLRTKILFKILTGSNCSPCVVLFVLLWGKNKCCSIIVSTNTFRSEVSCGKVCSDVSQLPSLMEWLGAPAQDQRKVGGSQEIRSF